MNTQLLFLAGHATKDAEILESQAKKKYARFDLAVNRYLGKEKGEVVSYYQCLLFDKTAEKLAELVKKGTAVIVTGRPETDSYTSKEGEVVSQIKVFVEEWEVLGKQVKEEKKDSK